MAEVPDRKVLKDVLARLKARTMSSISDYRGAITDALKFGDDRIKDLKEFESKQGISSISVPILMVIEGKFLDVIKESGDLIDDMKLYIEALENYSSVLDQAFWGGIEEQAKRLVEERNEQQEELRKKQQELHTKSTDYIK